MSAAAPGLSRSSLRIFRCKQELPHVARDLLCAGDEAVAFDDGAVSILKFRFELLNTSFNRSWRWDTRPSFVVRVRHLIRLVTDQVTRAFEFKRRH